MKTEIKKQMDKARRDSEIKALRLSAEQHLRLVKAMKWKPSDD